jgi:hypothetical protein
VVGGGAAVVARRRVEDEARLRATGCEWERCGEGDRAHQAQTEGMIVIGRDS